MKQQTARWDSLLLMAVVFLASVCAQVQAQERKVEVDGAKADRAEVAEVEVVDAADALDGASVVEKSVYWIGVSGRSLKSDVLRTQFQLASDMGVVVEEVVVDSPAAKAGLRKHDILLRCNGAAVHDMQVLQDLVRAGNEKPIEMEIIRLAKNETLVVVPEPLPENVKERMNASNGRVRQGFNLRNLEQDALRQLLGQFGARNIGAGVIMRGMPMGGRMAQVPNGFSVSIRRSNNEPAQITVRQGDKTWEIQGDDAKALEQLPPDVRSYVEDLLNGQQQGGQGFQIRGGLEEFDREMLEMLPGRLGGFIPQQERPDPKPIATQADMEERMKQMEKRLQELHKLVEAFEAEE